MRKKKIILLSISIFMLSLIGILYAMFYGIFQEGNPVPVVKGIYQLRTKNVVFSQISSSPEKYIARVGNEQIFDEFAKIHGWKFIEQEGAMLYYKDENDKQVEVFYEMLTKFYLCFEVLDS